MVDANTHTNTHARPHHNIQTSRQNERRGGGKEGRFGDVVIWSTDDQARAKSLLIVEKETTNEHRNTGARKNVVILRPLSCTRRATMLAVCACTTRSHFGLGLIASRPIHATLTQCNLKHAESKRSASVSAPDDGCSYVLSWQNGTAESW